MLLEGPAGPLELLLEYPAEGADPVDRVAVICHPHPLHGGTMHNKVVHTLARAARDLGAVSVRFNFRGVGASGGQYGEAIGETQDLEAVGQWERQRWPGAELWLAGFSFGAYVALRGAATLDPGQMVTVAPPVNFFDVGALPSLPCRWLLVQGTEDEIVPSAQVMTWVSELEPAPELLTLEGAGHFFHGRLNELRQGLVLALKDR